MSLPSPRPSTNEPSARSNEASAVPSTVLRWAAWGAFCLATALAYVEKRPIADAMRQRRDHPALDAIAQVANVVGSGYSMLAIALLAIAIGSFTKTKALSEAARVYAYAGALCGLATWVAQWVLAEQRPLAGGAMRWFARDGHGLSGHAAAAALLFEPMRCVLLAGLPVRARNIGVALVGGWALLVGWSRTWLGMHYLWNVLLGLGLGLAVGHAGVRVWRRCARADHAGA